MDRQIVNWKFWQRREERSYTDQRVTAIVSSASADNGVEYGATAVDESCRGLWGRAFAQSIVEPENSIASEALTADVLGLVGAELYDRGEFLAEIVVENGRVQLAPACDYEIEGERGRYRYIATFAEPEKQVRRTLPADAVVHLRLPPSTRRPWAGVSPVVGRSNVTAQLHAQIQTKLKNEATGVSGYVVPVPGDDHTDDLQADLKKLSGGTVLFPSTAGGLDSEPASHAPRKDWESVRLGIDPPQSLVALNEMTGQEICAAAGVPPSLFNPTADGTAQLNSWRRFVVSTIGPIGRMLAPEIQRKLDSPDFRFAWRRLNSVDHAMRARAVRGYVDAGIPADVALEYVGVLEEV